MRKYRLKTALRSSPSEPASAQDLGGFCSCFLFEKTRFETEFEQMPSESPLKAHISLPRGQCRKPANTPWNRQRLELPIPSYFSVSSAYTNNTTHKHCHTIVIASSAVYRSAPCIALFRCFLIFPNACMVFLRSFGALEAI